MARLNTKAEEVKVFTHEGGRAYGRMTTEEALRRSVLSCFLFEREFYEDGVEISKRIGELCRELVKEEGGASVISKLAIEARTKANLRHVPLLLLSVLSDIHKGDSLVSDTAFEVIRRPDELAEVLAVYCDYKGTTPDKIKSVLPHGLARGISRAFGKFDAYGLGKYNRDNKIKLRDVLFLTHPKPKDEAQKAIWEKLISGTLESPDTWEVELSAGKDKKETFERLIREGKLGYLALLRNLRNMMESKCDERLIKDAILARKGGADRVLPFRFVAAARVVPQLEKEIDEAMLASLENLPRFRGKTVVLVDVSGSMDVPLSRKSDLRRCDAAAALASIIQGDDIEVFSFSNALVHVPPRKGMAGVDAILRSQGHGGTELFSSIEEVNKNVKYDRLIVLTDEQATGTRYWGKTRVCPDPVTRGYVVNLASAKNGVLYEKWTHLDGFSENVIRFISEIENFKVKEAA